MLRADRSAVFGKAFVNFHFGFSICQQSPHRLVVNANCFANLRNSMPAFRRIWDIKLLRQFREPSYTGSRNVLFCVSFASHTIVSVSQYSPQANPRLHDVVARRFAEYPAASGCPSHPTQYPVGCALLRPSACVTLCRCAITTLLADPPQTASA